VIEKRNFSVIDQWSASDLDCAAMISAVVGAGGEIAVERLGKGGYAGRREGGGEYSRERILFTYSTAVCATRVFLTLAGGKASGGGGRPGLFILDWRHGQPWTGDEGERRSGWCSVGENCSATPVIT
jgi:hypothetical protein